MTESIGDNGKGHTRKASTTATPDDAPSTPGDDEAVGYGKPPAQHRFAKGRSGNPTGSSKRRRDAAAAGRYLSNPAQAAILAEADRVVTVRENGKTLQLTMRELLTRRLMLDATKGGATAMRLVSQLLGTAEAAKRREVEEQATFIMHTKMDGEAALKRAKAAGLPPPLLLPHPDDIEVDPYTLNIAIRGPIDEAGYALAKQTASLRDGLISEIAELEVKKRRSAKQEARLAILRRVAADLEARLPPSFRAKAREEEPDATPAGKS